MKSPVFVDRHDLCNMLGHEAHDRAGRKVGQGSKWIAQSTRLAIYLRDGLSCAYCGARLEDGAQLSLDHLRPCVAGGSNAPTNLVTCCKHCNDSRQDRPVRTFCRAVAEYLAVDWAEIERHVRACARRDLPRAEARELIERRGSYSNVIRSGAR